MSRRWMRSPLFWTTTASLGIVLACASGERSKSGGSAGWDTQDRSANEEPEEQQEQDDTGATEEPEDTSATEDTALVVDTAVEDACDDESPVVLYMSPDDSNSMSSPSQVRAAVLGGWAQLEYVTIRSWEFMNYYQFDYEPPVEEDLALSLQLAPYEEGSEDDWLLQIAVTAPDIGNEDRAPMNLTFVVDSSGSMSGEPLALAQQVLIAASSQLKEGDIVSVVSWNTSNNVVLANHEHQGPFDLSLRWAAENLEADGATDLHSGLMKGYELARNSYSSGRINRVVLISDGGANAGITSLQLISEQADRQDEEGIYLVGVGVGSPGTYHDLLMDRVTDAGKGASVFVDSEEEAWEMFAGRFVNTMGVAARDVELMLALPPGFEVMRFSGEGLSTEPDVLDPQHIAPNDSMVFYNHLATCAPELLDDSAAIGVTVRYKDAVGFEQRELSLQTSWGELLGADTALLYKGRAVYTYAESLKRVILEPTQSGREEAIDRALAALSDAELLNPEDEDLAEIRAVLEALDSQPILGHAAPMGLLSQRFQRDRAVISALEESRR
jgi:Ca-activated chloride channel family protein